MPQRFRLDRRTLAPYLALVLLGCTPLGVPRSSVVPVAAVPLSADQLRAFVEPTRPDGYLLLRFRWLFKDERSSAGGSGSARIAHADSLRFDVRGPLGAGASAAVVVGDSAQWVEPPDAIEKLVPNYPLMWGMLGVAELPPAGATVRGVENGAVRAWQYAMGPDTVEYVRTKGERNSLVTVVRQRGKVLGKAEIHLAADGTPVKARLDVPARPARLDLTFTQRTAPTGFKPETWDRPRP